jgi:hypothetical protein
MLFIVHTSRALSECAEPYSRLTVQGRFVSQEIETIHRVLGYSVSA